MSLLLQCRSSLAAKKAKFPSLALPAPLQKAPPQPHWHHCNPEQPCPAPTGEDDSDPGDGRAGNHPLVCQNSGAAALLVIWCLIVWSEEATAALGLWSYTAPWAAKHIKTSYYPPRPWLSSVYCACSTVLGFMRDNVTAHGIKLLHHHCSQRGWCCAPGDMWKKQEVWVFKCQD